MHCLLAWYFNALGEGLGGEGLADGADLRGGQLKALLGDEGSRSPVPLEELPALSRISLRVAPPFTVSAVHVVAECEGLPRSPGACCVVRDRGSSPGRQTRRAHKEGHGHAPRE
jgi:hypothetical protein